MQTPSTVSIRESDGNIVTFEPHKILASTADLARKYANNGYPDRYVVFAEKQVRSRLLNTRTDDVEAVSGIFMSLILRPSFFPSQASLLGAMSATALISALEEHTPEPLGLGWVSDLYCRGTRIGNVSIEGRFDSFTAYEYLIISFSVVTDSTNFPPRLTDMIKKVFDTENTSISMIMARNILSKFFKFYQCMKTPDKFMDIYASRFALRGVVARCDLGDKKRLCKIVDIDRNSGALLVDAGDAEPRRISSPSMVSIPRKIRMKRKPDGQKSKQKST